MRNKASDHKRIAEKESTARFENTKNIAKHLRPVFDMA
jgi:hypothetical protein